jgi:hypothetical protein
MIGVKVIAAAEPIRHTFGLADTARHAMSFD